VNTESEAVFKRNLEGQNMKWSRLPASDEKQPDLSVSHGNQGRVPRPRFRDLGRTAGDALFLILA
jgi:hypothetical protein